MKKTTLLLMMIFFAQTLFAEQSFIAMRKKITDTSITDIQRKQIIKSYIGKRVSYQGWVEDVQEKGGRYFCLIDMDSPNVAFSLYDFKIQISESAAMSLRKGQIIYVAGKIKRIDNTISFQVDLSDMQISLNPIRY